MAIYESEFKGATIDARLAAVATMQTAISNLETAVAAKYSKPANGIPETDLDEAVQSALALARSAVQSLSDYYTKAQVDDIAAAIAASVDSTSGVVVTSLPTAGADTLGKIYYVGPDASGFYDRYVTSYDGSTYSWLPLGNTEVDMAQYATVEQLNQLDEDIREALPSPKHKSLPITENDLEQGNISASGAIGNSPDYVRHTPMYINVSDYETLTYSVNNSYRLAVALYDEKAAFIEKQEWLTGEDSADISDAYYMLLVLAPPVGETTFDFSQAAPVFSLESSVLPVVPSKEEVLGIVDEELYKGNIVHFELGSIKQAYGYDVDPTDGTKMRTGYLDKKSGRFVLTLERDCSNIDLFLYKEGNFVGRIGDYFKSVNAGIYQCSIQTEVDFDQFRILCITTDATDQNVSNNTVEQESIYTHFSGEQIDIEALNTNKLYALYDELVKKYPDYISRRVLGYDSSGTHEIREYVAVLRNQYAYLYVDRCYAWKNGSTVIYTASISPRVGDATYTDHLTTPTGQTVSSSDVTTIESGGTTFARFKEGDLAADIVYRNTGDAATVVSDGKTYVRHPNYDKAAATEKTVVSVCNEHGPGGDGDPREPSVVMYLLLKSLCGNTDDNEEMSWLKKHGKLVVIPVLNPFAYDEETSQASAGQSKGRVNYNGVNINRNYPTANWESTSESGAYPGSEVETQYAINCIMRHGADIAIDEHCLGPSVGNHGKWHYEGDLTYIIDQDTIAMMSASYNLLYSSYGAGAPGRGDNWIHEQGIDGGLLEMNQGYNDTLNSEQTLDACRQIWLNVLRLYDVFPEGGGGSSVTVDEELSPTSVNPVENAAIYNALSGKQAALVSGENIKTINGVSILGSGDMTVGGGGTIAVDSELDLTSKNPVENGVITAALNAKSDFSGDYNDLTNKPTIPAAQVQSDWNEANASSKAYIQNKPTIPAAQVQSDWNETDTSSKAYIQNKPSIPAAQEQSDWNESDASSKAFIKNKPTIPAGVVVDQTYDPTSANAQSGVALAGALAGKQDTIDAAHKLDYSLIANTPTIPSTAGLEETANKVTTLSALSTDTQYPSAKCVYNIVGDIETLINAL